VHQREPKTGRPQKTDLLNFRIEVKKVLINWIDLLKNNYNFTDADPLFPAIHITTNGDCLQFEKDGFNKEFIKPNAIRIELQKHFKKYDFTPHTVRHSLTHFFFECELTKEQEKAFSQNLGHKDLFTTQNSYYSIPEIKKTQIVKNFDIEKMKQRKGVRNNPEYAYILSQLDNPEIMNKAL
jgi:integrase